MRLRLACFALGVLGTTAGACVQSDPPVYDAIAYCTDVAQAKCQIANTCAVDQAGCQMHEYAQCNLDATTATQPRTRIYNSDNAKACVWALQSAYGPSVTTIGAAQLKSVSDLCQRVYVGLAAAGDSCRMDYDCAPGLSCVSPKPGATPAVCGVAQPVKQGQACATLGSQCEPGTYCNSHGSGNWTCDAAPSAGQPCAQGAYCASDAYCVDSMCVPRPEAGQPCVPDADQCAADSPYCDEYSKTCATGMTFHPGSIDCEGISGVSSTVDAALEGGEASDPDGSSP